MNTNPEGIYDPEYIQSLFDKMSKTGELANSINSFGFTERWRVDRFATNSICLFKTADNHYVYLIESVKISA